MDKEPPEGDAPVIEVTEEMIGAGYLAYLRAPGMARDGMVPAYRAMAKLDPSRAPPPDRTPGEADVERLAIALIVAYYNTSISEGEKILGRDFLATKWWRRTARAAFAHIATARQDQTARIAELEADLFSARQAIFDWGLKARTLEQERDRAFKAHEEVTTERNQALAEIERHRHQNTMLLSITGDLQSERDDLASQLALANARLTPEYYERLKAGLQANGEGPPDPALPEIGSRWGVGKHWEYQVNAIVPNAMPEPLVMTMGRFQGFVTRWFTLSAWNDWVTTVEAQRIPEDL